MNPSYVYDIETENWTTFVIGALYDGKRIEIYDWTREREFVTRLLSLRGEVYAHNGGRFDHLWLLDAAFRFGLQRHAKVIENSTGIVSLEIGEARFLDSFRLFPMSLRRLTNGAKQTLSDLCNCGKNCEGYCAINRRMPRRVRERITDYLRSDVCELWKALGHFQIIARECQIELGMTIGGTSWKSAYRELHLPEQPYGDSIAQWKFARQGYYGGRSEIFKMDSESGFQYDVNSMYPAKIASVPLPIDYQGKLYGNSSSRAFARGAPGIYRARIMVPESYIPPLPYRTRKGRIVYPHGVFDGVWTALELQYAESKGCRIESISEGAVFRKEQIIFKSWVERIFKVRMKYGKDSREGYWLKFILNSITGKFGAKVGHRSFLIDPCFAGKACKCGGKKIDDITGWTMLGHPATSRVFYKDIERLSKNCHVEWAAYLTSAARITLHQGLTDGNKNDAVYCDTDSIFSEGVRKKNVGNALGQWKEEGRFEDFHALAPKVYCYHKAETGALTVRAKGIPNPNDKDAKANAKFWKDLIDSKPIEYWSIAGIRNPNAEGMFFVRRYLTRKVNRNTGGRLPDGPSETRAPGMEYVRMTFD